MTEKGVTIYVPNEPAPIDKPTSGSLVPSESGGQAPSGVVQSVVTGFLADVERHSIEKLTKRAKAVTEFTDARRDLADSQVKAARSFGALADLGNTLDDDQAERDAARRRAQFLRDQEKEKQDAEAKRRGMREQITDLELQAQLQEAQHRLNAARHGVLNFAASTDARVQETKSVWEAKATSAEAERLEQQALMNGGPPPAEAIADPKHTYLQSLQTALDNAIADGDHGKAERLRRTIAAVSET